MQFARESLQRHTIRRYDETTVWIADDAYKGSLAVSSDQIVTDWTCDCVESLDDALIGAIADLNPEVVVIATGSSVVFPAAPVLHPLMRAGIGVEVMNDGAAIRTFNVLLSEGRRAALALIR
ncbi:MAG: MTH938/NDUFAF3 family protein [Pseudomonadota bacterium]